MEYLFYNGFNFLAFPVNFLAVLFLLTGTWILHRYYSHTSVVHWLTSVPATLLFTGIIILLLIIEGIWAFQLFRTYFFIFFLLILILILGLVTLNSFTASDSVLIPVQCEYFALEGLGQLMNTINLVKKHLNKEIKIEGAVLTMYDIRTNLANQVVKEVKKYFQDI